MPPSNRSLVPGIILIALGILFLLPNFVAVRGRDLWPLLMIGAGIVFYVAFFLNRSNFGLLMPATILTVYGSLFYYCKIEGWESITTLWPFFMIGPGLGLILMYLFGKKEPGLLIPAGMLITLGLIFLLGATRFDYLWPALLILAGLFVLLGGRRTGRSS
jgi:hypothetical protein